MFIAKLTDYSTVSGCYLQSHELDIAERPLDAVVRCSIVQYSKYYTPAILTVRHSI